MSVLMGWHFFCAISAGIIKNINLKNINVVCKNSYNLLQNSHRTFLIKQ